jgi:hypothetical protein
MLRCIQSVNEFGEAARENTQLSRVQRGSLRAGDWMFFRTDDAVYTVRMLDDEECIVSGGWFDEVGIAPLVTAFHGCGGNDTSVLAACGMCLEFREQVITSPIRTIVLLPVWSLN